MNGDRAFGNHVVRIDDAHSFEDAKQLQPPFLQKLIEEGTVSTIEEHKTRIIHQLGELKASGSAPVLPLQEIPSDDAIRAVAELEADGIIVFEDDSLSCRLTSYGSKIADALIQKEQVKQKPR